MNRITVSSTPARFRHDISIGNKFHLTADEPLDVGGDDTGPTPLDFVLAGLGSCQAITLKMYAERHNADGRDQTGATAAISNASNRT